MSSSLGTASVQKTLIDIASVSQRVGNALTRYAAHKPVESFNLERIVIGCQSTLEILNNKLPPEENRVDDRLTDWLKSKEPQVCLDTLNRIEEILNGKVQSGAKTFLKVFQRAPTQDKNNEAIDLFRKHQGYFHFLLTTDVWNRERNVYQQSCTSVQHNTQCAEGVPDTQDLTHVTHRDSKHTYSAPQGNPVDQGKLSTILGRLNALHCKEAHRRTILLRQADTCAWLPKTNEFRAWRKTEDSDSFLWLHGKAGAGKSVLTASVIEHLENTLQDGELLLYFYCDFRNERSTNPAEVMRSLLSQLLQPFTHRTIGSASLIDDLEKEGTLLVNDLTLLSCYISRVAQNFNQQPICIVDALDECNDIEKLLDALNELRNAKIRWFVTSRPLQVIKDGLFGLPSISMDKKNFEVATDIALHVERELDFHRRLRSLEPDLKSEIGSTLCDEADGMFRWVYCQLNTLKRCMTPAQMRKTLNDLPRDLEATYSRILLSIDEDEWEVARRALYWLVVAFGPLELCQIWEGLSIDTERQVFDHDSAPVHRSALLDALSSLVTYDESTDLITLSHASVKDFLISESTHSTYPLCYIAEQDAHTKLALLCMSYILAYLKQHTESNGYAWASQNLDRGRMRSEINSSTVTYATRRGSPLPPFRSYQLLTYVLRSGFWHLAYIDPEDMNVLHAIKAFGSEIQPHAIEWERLRERFWSNMPTLKESKHDIASYILVAFAPAPLLRLYVDHAQLKQRDGMNPLIYAAHRRSIEHATILLSNGACLARKGWDLGGHSQSLPIEVAIGNRDTNMVDLFLKWGSPVPCELFENMTERFRPFTCITLKLLQTDEFVEWASTIPSKQSLSHMFDPTSRHIFDEDHMECIERRLVQIGCDPSVWFDGTKLRCAVRANNLFVVKRMISNGNVPLPPDIILHARSWEMISFLLDLGNNVHAVSPKGDTLLHLFVRFEDLETIQALVAAGCNPSACNLAGKTPLHVAVEYDRQYSIVEYLFSLMETPFLPPDILLSASSFPMMSFLLEKGADVHVIAADGDTPLHVALRHDEHEDRDQCLEVTKRLVNAGCDPCLPNTLGETPLHVAAHYGHLPVVQYLLSLGVPLPSDILLSVVGTSTSMAIPCINLLLENGADVHAMSPNGDNLLCISVVSGLEVTEEECLRRVKILIGAGCGPHECNTAGESLIHIAARRGYTTVLEYLLSLGLPIPCDLMRTAHFNGWRWPDHHTIRSLLETGYDACTVAKNGDTLLHHAVEAVTEKDALDLAKLLVQFGCSPSASNFWQETPFSIASSRGHISVISYFLSLGEPLPSNILFSASRGYSEATKMIRYLIQQGADATIKDEAGATPLHRLRGSDYDRLQSTKILIDAGCDPQSEDLHGMTPMHFAAQNGYVSVIEYLLSRGIPPPRDILIDSTANVFSFLLRNGANVHSFIPILPLHHVLSHFDEEDCLERASILINIGCDPNVQNWLGETPIHIAAKNNHLAVVKYLHSQNAAVPSDVLLHVVPELAYCVGERVPLFRFFICEGTNVNASTDNGDTPLHLALRCAIDEGYEWRHYDEFRGWCKLIEVLLNAGANLYIQNADGKNAFDLAEEGGQLFKDNFLRLVWNASAVHQAGTVPADLSGKTPTRRILEIKP